MELSNKVVQGYVNGELTNIAPATMSDNVYLQSNNSKTIDTGLITTYTHTRTGTVNEFTGTGSNGKALMTADVEAGDTFTVNGAPVTAYIGAKDAAVSMAGSSWNGKWIRSRPACSKKCWTCRSTRPVLMLLRRKRRDCHRNVV